MPNLLEVMENYECFNYALRACRDGGLVAMLTHEGDFTIFAPNDNAFDNLKPILIKAIFEDPATMMNLMLHHSVEWSLDSRALEDAKKLRTLGEDMIKVKAKKGVIKVEGANVVEANIEADNGIIHMIDTVLLPPEIKILA